MKYVRFFLFSFCLMHVSSSLFARRGPGFLRVVYDGDYEKVESFLGASEDNLTKFKDYQDVKGHKDLRKDTPLIISAFKAHTRIFKLLGNNQANLYQKNSLGETALMIAAYTGQVELVKYILAKTGTDLLNEVSYYNSHGSSFISGGGAKEKNAVAYSGGNALHYALSGTFTTEKKLCALALIDAGINLHQLDAERRTPILMAFDQKDEGVFSEILNHRSFQVNFQSEENFTVQHVSLNPRKLALDPKKLPVKTQSQTFLMHLSAQKGSQNYFEMFLTKEGLNPNLRDSNGNTALMYASSYGKLDKVKALLTHPYPKVDASLKNSGGRSAYDMAKKKGHKKILALLPQPAPEKKLSEEEEVSEEANADDSSDAED